MDYLRRTVLGTPSSSQAQAESPGAVETIERLVDRILSSSLLEDRRDACRALKALSKSYRVEVGAQGMEALKQILNIDRSDNEIIGLALNTLCNITNPEASEEEIQAVGGEHNMGEQFTEILVKNQEVVDLILRYIEEFDFQVRWPALKLFANLLANKPKIVQDIILTSPLAISKLMDMLSDSREVIRNDSLLLLIQLTKGNSNIQKIVAFENAFDRIYDIIFQEGSLDGGIVVEDCMLLMINLLQGNYSNQNFFIEGCYIQKLTPLFTTSIDVNDCDSGTGWSPQKVSNVYIAIQIIRTLVAPSGPSQVVLSCQKVMNSCGLLNVLCNIIMMSGVPANVLTETICGAAEIIRGNTNNQELVANFMAPSDPPRPAIVILLMSMINERQPFHLRCAVLYCLQCFLYKNELHQLQLIQTLLPQDSNVGPLSTGQLLCGGLFSADSLSNWFSAVGLSHALLSGLNQKEQLLRVLLATNTGVAPVPLMDQCVMLLQHAKKTQSKLGILILLCQWTAFSVESVKNFLSIDSSMSYLIALLCSHDSNNDLQELILQSVCAYLIGICVHFNDDTVSAYTKTNLCKLIENRIGLHKFQDTLSQIKTQEIYSRALKHPQLTVKEPSEVLLDYEFCRLLQNLHDLILKTVLESNSPVDMEKQTAAESPVLAQYKKVIREQDLQIQQLKELLDQVTKEKTQLQQQMDKVTGENKILLDQNIVLRASQSDTTDKGQCASCNKTTELLNQEMEKSRREMEDLNNRLLKSSDIIEELKKSQLVNNQVEEFQKKIDEKTNEVNKMRKDQEDLLELLTDQDNKISFYKKKLLDLGEKIESDDSCDELDIDNRLKLSS